MVISLDVYREHREVAKGLKKINSYFVQNFAEKSWGWVAMTALLFSELALENYIATAEVDPKFKPALKTVLWQYMNVLNEKEKE